MKTIKVGDFVTLSFEKGYTESACKEAMQVMEIYEHTLTAKRGKDKCITKNKSHFKKIDSLDKFKVIHQFELLKKHTK